MAQKDSLIHLRPLQVIYTRRFLLARTNQFKHIKIIYCHKNLVTKKLDAETSQSRICWLRASCTKYFSFSWCNECIWIHKIFHGSKRFIDSCRSFKVMSTRCNSYLYAQIFSSTSNNITAVYFHYTLVKPSVLSFNFSAILLEMLLCSTVDSTGFRRVGHKIFHFINHATKICCLKMFHAHRSKTFIDSLGTTSAFRP